MGSVSRIVAVILLAGALAHIEPAASSTPEPQWTPSFNESPGCSGPYENEVLNGVRGPLADKPYINGQASIPSSHPVYGPWGDMYGRTQGAIHSQLVKVHLPGLSKDLWVHNRVLPAFNQVLANLAAEAANGNTYEIRSDTWSYNPVTIPPGRTYSFHTVGAAIDVNSNTNPYRADNVLITDMIEDDADHPNPDWFVDAWRDAGFCWGGDWQSIKDPMHFSWMGPLHDPTPGYIVPSPQPPLVAQAPFTAGQYLPAALPAVGAERYAVADMDRDGAADIVRLRTQPGGTVRLDIAEARSWFRDNSHAGTTAVAPGDPAAPFALADLNRDGRPDLVYVLDTAGVAALEVFTFTGLGGSMPRSTVATSIPIASGDVYLFDDYNRDGNADLFVVRAGNPSALEVWLGPTFESTAVEVALTVPSSNRQFALGERWVNGVPDLFAVASDGTIVIYRGSTGYTQTQSTVSMALLEGRTTFVADLDGDGYGDLLLVGAEGSTQMLRGGASTHEAGTWFVIDTSLVPDYGASPFSHEISWLIETGVSKGCNPPIYSRYCPDRLLTRGEMATLMVRVLGLEASADDGPFVDHFQSVHRTNINAIRIAEVTVGCADHKYCPGRTLTRAEIATLLYRPAGLPQAQASHFTDIAGHWGEIPINAMAEAGIAWACNPPANDRFCPGRKVSREEMAAWLYKTWRAGYLPHLGVPQP